MAAMAGITAEEAAKLKGELMPMGGERAGKFVRLNIGDVYALKEKAKLLEHVTPELMRGGTASSTPVSRYWKLFNTPVPVVTPVWVCVCTEMRSPTLIVMRVLLRRLRSAPAASVRATIAATVSPASRSRTSVGA